MNPKDAYEIGVVNGPCDMTRKAACKSPHFAKLYAAYVDKQAMPETEAGVAKDPVYAFDYARLFGITDTLRKAMLKSPDAAMWLAQDLEGASDETRSIACQNAETAFYYAVCVDQKPMKQTWEAIEGYYYLRNRYASEIGTP